jgi:hypothetical protein
MAVGLKFSPFVFVWTGAHLLLAPAASHSGVADHFQSDSYHANHHARFEVNLAGLSAAFLDVLFNSFLSTYTSHLPVTKRSRSSASRKKKSSDNIAAGAAAAEADEEEGNDVALQIQHDAKADLFTPIPVDQVVYNVLALLSLAVPLLYLASHEATRRIVDTKLFRGNAELARMVLPWVFAAGPAVVAFVLSKVCGHPPRKSKWGKYSTAQDYLCRSLHMLMVVVPLAAMIIYGL